MSKNHQQTTARPRGISARRAAEARAARSRRTRILVSAAIAVTVVGLLTLAALTGKQASPLAGHVVDHAAHATSAHAAGTALPPWPNAADPTAAIGRAGLTPTSSEGTADHYHAHLDVIVNGAAVPVAADIGVDEAARLISPLHTHDGTGTIHIESPVAGDKFYLGQLFTEWNVALSATTLGGLSTDAGTTLRAYVDGVRVSGDPADILLAPHQEIALVFAPADQQVDVPSGYDFGDL